MMPVDLTGPGYHAEAHLTPSGLTLIRADHDAPGQDVLTISPTPDQADAFAAQLAEWAARVRARQFANDQPELMGLLP